MKRSIGKVVIGVLTYRRVEELHGLLPEVEQQIAGVDHPDFGILVIDNDPEAGAREMVTSYPGPLVRYVHEPAPGIAHGRNRALDECADAHLLIFIDDDERPNEGWLRALLDTYASTRAAAATGPVYPDYEASPDAWLVAGGFFIRKQYPDGQLMPAAGSGNLLLDLDRVREFGLRFDERFGLTGGSDTLFTRQLVKAGGQIRYVAAAGVVDKVPMSRMNRKWALGRYYRVGNTWSRTSVELADGPLSRSSVRLQLTTRGAGRAAFGAGRTVAGLITRNLGHRARGERAVVRGLGMMAGAWGGVYQEYRRPERTGNGGADVSPLRRGYRWLRKRAKRTLSYCWLAALHARNRSNDSPVVGDAAVVVSLTTYGDRLATVAYTIESIAAGTVRPRRLVLWLDDPTRFSRRPESLRRLERRGLEVRLTENHGPHTKYYPALDLAIDDGLPLVTADDDILYPTRWLTGLLQAAAAHPDAVNCYRAGVVALRDGVIAPYVLWPRCRDSTAGLARFATGVSGVHYPPAMLAELRRRGTEFERYSARADDIWLHWVALRSGIKVRQIAATARHFPYIPGTQEHTLAEENVGHGANDRYVAGLYTAEDVERLRKAGAPLL